MTSITAIIDVPSRPTLLFLEVILLRKVQLISLTAIIDVPSRPTLLFLEVFLLRKVQAGGKHNCHLMSLPGLHCCF